MNQSPLYSLESEQAVLGCCLAQPGEVFEDVGSSLIESDFFVPAHRAVFKCLCELFFAGRPIDVMTVHQWLADKKLAERAGSPGILAELLTGFATHLNVSAYVRIVKEKSTLRALQEACAEIVRDVVEMQDSIPELLTRSEKRICSIAETGSNDRSLNAMACVARFKAQQGRIEAGIVETRLKTGLMALDQINGGLPAPGYVVIAGEPGVGKSALILNIMTFCASHGMGVGGHTAEMTNDQCIQRMVAGMARMDSRQMNAPMAQEWRDKRDYALDKISRLPFYLDESSGLTPRDLRIQARKWVKLGCKLIWLDNAQLMTGTDQGRARTEQLTEVSRTIQNIQKEHGITYILLAQVTKEALKNGKQLQAFDLADCASFQRDARVMIMIEKDPEATIFPAYSFPLVTRIVKYSEGETGSFKSTFNKPQQQIT